MQDFNTVLFDLDGTLVDSSEGITKSVAYALKKRGYGETNPTTLTHFIGPPLREQFMQHCGTDKDEGAALVTAYREYYTDKGMFECAVYDGIPELLCDLRARGKSLLVATSKPELFARKILAHFSLDGYFDYIGGANLDNTRTRKSEVIAYTLQSAPELKIPRRSVMVGDCTHDIDGAAAVGLPAIAVSYGFGRRDELEASEPLCICDFPAEIGRVLKS